MKKSSFLSTVVCGISLVSIILILFIPSSIHDTNNTIELKSNVERPTEYLRKEYQSATSKHFLSVLCLERSGSTWLTDMLNRNQGVKILAEPIGHLAAASKKNPNKAQAASIELQVLISKLDDITSNSTAKLIGFNEKLLYPKFALPLHYTSMLKLASYLQDKKFKLIILIRKNLLQQAVSMLRATQLANACGDAGWSRVKQPGWDEICGVHLSKIAKSVVPLLALEENIEVVIRNTKQLLDTAATLNVPHLVIYYEDMWMNTAETFSLISEWVHYPLTVKDTIFIKQTEVKLTDIPNIMEIQSFLRDSYPCLESHLYSSNPSLSCLSIKKSNS